MVLRSQAPFWFLEAGSCPAPWQMEQNKTGGAGQTGTILANKCMVWYGKESERRTHILWTEANLKRWKERGVGWRGWHGYFWAWAAAGVHVWLHGLVTAMGCIDFCGSWEDRVVQSWLHSLTGCNTKENSPNPLIIDAGSELAPIMLETSPWCDKRVIWAVWQMVSFYLSSIQANRAWFKNVCLTFLFLLALLNCRYLGKMSHTRSCYIL